jgi:nucleotide-binding universal stress UspA family protein
MPTLQSILVPMDGSPPSIAALFHAVVLAKDYGASLDVLHVIPVLDPLTTDARADVERAMAAAVTHAQDSLGRKISRTTVVGDPLREIVEAASKADLVVMGTHGFVGRLHEILGSTTEAVVRSAPCPVLTVRDESGGYQSFAEARHHRPTLAEQVETEAHDQPRGR